MRPRLLSLFSGIGGFDLGFHREGFELIGLCEVDPQARAVLAHHFPDTPIHEDVTTLDAMRFGPADVVVFGSPCQDLSVAGQRRGLQGERSGLFMQAMRIISEMQEATNGEYPKYAVWENVPGAFSSNGGHDFAAVLSELAGGPVHRAADGWAPSGVVFGPRRQVAWRVLDSQHFGVPQRRNRIFAVLHLGGECAGAVLFEPDGLPGHPAPGREPEQAVAGRPSARPDRRRTGEGVAQTLSAVMNGLRYDAETETFVVQPLAFESKASAARPQNLSQLSPTLEAQDKVAVTLGEAQVRRLTPTECERLQGFPDGWTLVVWKKRLMADAARYRMCGNAVTVNVAQWLAHRLRLALEGRVLELWGAS